MTGDSDGRIIVYNEDGKFLTKFKAHLKQINFLKQLPNGLVASSSVDTTVKIWNTHDWSLVITYSNHLQSTYGLDYLENNTIASCSMSLSTWTQLKVNLKNPTIHFWSMTTGQSLKTLYASDTKFAGSVFALKMLPQGQLATGVSYDLVWPKIKSKIKIWNVTTGTSTKSYDSHTSKIRDIVLINNDTLASSGDDGSIIISNHRTGAILHNLNGHNSSVYGLKVVSTEILASGSEDKTIKLWNTTDGKLIRNLSGHTDKIFYSLDMISEDVLVSGSLDNTLKYWRISTGKLVKTQRSTSQITALIVI